MAKGFPQHGDVYSEDEEGQDPNEEGQDHSEGDDKGDKTPKESLEQRLDRIERENAELRGRLQGIQETRPRAEDPKPTPKPKKDWEKMLFDDTDNAVEELRKEITEEVTSKVRGEYQQDQSTKDFWNEFYRKNHDLDRDKDHDIVQTILNKNFNSLGDMPVSQAVDKLGELTRERIIQYTGKKETKADRSSKATAEGANAPSPKPAPKEEDKVVTLSDIIRARKAKRSAAKAQTA